MGPLFSGLFFVVMLPIYALAAYATLRVIRRRAVSWWSIVGVVLGGVTGAAIAVFGVNPFVAGKTIESTEGVVLLLSTICVASIVFSILGLRIIERWRSRI